MYSNEPKTYVHTKRWAEMLTAVLFMNVEGWEQPRCPFSGWWVTRLAHPRNGILFPDEEKWTISHKKPRRNLKCIRLSERSLSEAGACCAAAAMRPPGKGKLRTQQKDHWLQGWREGVKVRVWGQWHYPCDTVTVGLQHDAFVKPGEVKCKLWTLVIINIDPTKASQSHWSEDTDKRGNGGVRWGWKKCMRTLLTHKLNFSVNIKLLKK